MRSAISRWTRVDMKATDQMPLRGYSTRQGRWKVLPELVKRVSAICFRPL